MLWLMNCLSLFSHEKKKLMVKPKNYWQILKKWLTSIAYYERNATLKNLASVQNLLLFWFSMVASGTFSEGNSNWLDQTRSSQKIEGLNENMSTISQWRQKLPKQKILSSNWKDIWTIGHVWNHCSTLLRRILWPILLSKRKSRILSKLPNRQLLTPSCVSINEGSAALETNLSLGLHFRLEDILM